MSHSHEDADLPDTLRAFARAVTVYAVCAAMLISSLVVFSPGASSDPVLIDNLDDTRSVVWDFDDPAGYTMTDVELLGGDAVLGRLNETDGDHVAGDYSEGTITDLDTARVSGAVTVAVSAEELTFDTQPGPGGVDSYLSESKVNDNFDDADSLMMDSETTKRLHIVMQFDFSSLPAEAVISDATLSLYQIPGSKGADVAFNVYQLTAPFIEADVTWVKSTSSTFWTTPGGDYYSHSFCRSTVTNGIGWMSLDVSKLVERWVRGEADNYGLIIVPVSAGGDNQKVFQSSDEDIFTNQNPKLTVNYTVPGGFGTLESQALGPGTNATFTLASFSTSVVSSLDDGFSGNGLSSKWSWMNNPALLGGVYDVGTTRPGWLHVTGSPNAQIHDMVIGCNYLYQNVTGDFTASTYLEDYFSVSSMGAGILVYESSLDWIYISKSEPGASGRIDVVVCENGTSLTGGTIPWTGYSSAHLSVERNSTGVWFYASTNGTSYQLAYHHSPAVQMMQEISIGLFVYSNSATKPTVDFDHFTVTPPAGAATEVRIRTGNSTSFSDPSWSDWSYAPVATSPMAVGEIGMYLQYRVYMSTPQNWFTPTFGPFDCWYERYAPSGLIETADHLPADFSMWYTMTTDETSGNGVARYSYSTDHGSTWTYAGTGGSYSIASTEPALKVRISIETYDTLTTPHVHTVSAMHGTAISHLYVVAPSTVAAGESFPVTIYAKDSSNATMVHWSGPIGLSALDVDGTDSLDAELVIDSATITSGGYVTVPNEMYTEAGAIMIKATAQDAYGFSGVITVTPGLPSSLQITPALDVLVEGTDTSFKAEVYDAFGNLVTGTEFAWSVDSEVGTLNRYTTSSVRLTAGDADGSGYLRVSSSGLDASLFITITHAANAPSFTEEVPDQAKYEDSGSWSVDLAPYVQDAVHEDDELRWYVTGETVVDVGGENRTGNMIITFSTELNLWGTDVLSLHVIDPDGLEAVTNLTVEIIPVNDWPTIDLIDPLVVHYDILYVYNLRYYVYDVDDPEEDLALSVDSGSSAYVSVERLALHMQYPFELNGTTQTVVVTVSDGMLSSSTVIQVTVSDDHVPVVVDSIPDMIMYQGDAFLNVFDLDDYFADPDDAVLFYAYGYDHIGVTISDDHYVSLFAPTDWYGTEYVVFSAIDSDGARVESATTIEVIRVNQAPTIDGIPDLVVKHDLRYEFDLAMYVSDPDDDPDDLHVTTSDPHVVPVGLILMIEYPESMVGQTLRVNVSVSDEELSDSCMVNVTVGNNTPPTIGVLPTHSFQEDMPMPYPDSGCLATYFSDDDGEPLTYEVFVSSAEVTAETVVDTQGVCTVEFQTEENWFGTVWFVVRATDPGGALVESMTELTVNPVPDAPVLRFNETIEVDTGVQAAVNLFQCATDPDMHSQALTFSVSNDYAEYATVIEGVLILEFPDEYLDGDEEQRYLVISVTVTDPEGLRDTDSLPVMVVKRVDGAGSSSWLMLGMVVMAAVASGSFIVAMRLRKKPFVIKDIMVVHNDGFLIGRAAEKTTAEIDEDILSGMLTAVLNFVEDSMAKTQDGLRSFGFDRYKVLVNRGKMTYIAVVHEGDAPDNMEERLGAFIAKVEKIYRKRIENWTGDMDTDFAGIEVLLQAFVKENSRRHRGLDESTRGTGGKKAQKKA